MAKTKRLLSLLLAVAMVLSLLPAIAFAAETETENETPATPAPGSDITFTDTATWPTAAGNWRLTGPVTVDTIWTNPGVVNLDLAGQTVTCTTRLFAFTGTNAQTVNIYDTEGGGKIVLTGYTAGGAFFASAVNSTVHVYGGTIDCSAITASGGHGSVCRISGANTKLYLHEGGKIITGKLNSSSQRGGIFINNGGTFIMEGGELVSGGKNTNSFGDCVYIDGGTFTMNGGKVYNGKALRGANIYLASGAFNMNGGELYNGNATQNADGVGGGNISVTGGTFTMTDGKIYGGDSIRGGNVLINGGTFKMEGGEIYEGYSGNSNWGGGNVFAYSGAFEMTGGVIRDGILRLNGGANLYNTGNCTVTINIEGDGRIGDNSYDHNGTNPAIHIACECGSKTGKHLEGCGEIKHTKWVPYTYEGKLVASDVPSDEGYYYLGREITFNKEKSQVLAEGAEVYLDLNGYNITYAGTTNRLWNLSQANAKLSISDSSGESVIDLGEASDMGALTAVSGVGAKLVLYGGKVDGSKVSATSGAVIRNTADGTIEIYGGEIIGGTVTRFGGAIYNSGNMTIGGGKIHSGIAGSLGGNIYTDGGVIIVKGGEISGGTAKGEGNTGAGGNIYSEGTLTVSGGEISGGNAGNQGGNIFNDGIFTITGGKVYGGTAHVSGGNIASSATSNLDGGEIYGGSVQGSTDADTAPAGNLYVRSGTTYLTGTKIYNSKVENCESPYQINVAIEGGTIDMSGGSIYQEKDYTGINVFVTEQQKFTMSGGEIYGSKGGANVFVAVKAAMTMTGGKIYNGSNPDNNGGNIDVDRGATLTISGGEIYGGTALNGGNIRGQSDAEFGDSVIVISGGKIYGGLANAEADPEKNTPDGRGGNIFAQGKLTLTGDAMIYNGEATSEDANNIYVAVGANFNTDGFVGTVCQKDVNSNGIYMNDSETEKNIDNDHFFVASKEGGIHCVCGAKSCVSLLNTRFGEKLSLLLAYDPAVLVGTPVVTVNGVAAEYEITQNGEYSVLEVKGLTAKQMSDRVHIDINGTTESFSLASYAMSVLETEDDEAYKTLIVDMLNYGAEAQKKFGYNTGSLANNQLTDEQKALASELQPVTNDRNPQATGGLFGGSNLRFNDEINLLFRFKIDADTFAVFTWGDGNSKKVTNKDYTYSSGYYVVELEDLTFADARVPVTCKIYDNADTEKLNPIVSVTDSIQANVARNIDSRDLYDAFMKFADSARAYLSKQ